MKTIAKEGRYKVIRERGTSQLNGRPLMSITWISEELSAYLKDLEEKLFKKNALLRELHPNGPTTVYSDANSETDKLKDGGEI